MKESKFRLTDQQKKWLFEIFSIPRTRRQANELATEMRTSLTPGQISRFISYRMRTGDVRKVPIEDLRIKEIPIINGNRMANMYEVIKK